MNPDRIKAALKAMNAFSQRYRWPLTGIGAVLLVAGIAWSVQTLEVTPSQIRPEYLLLVALLLVPAGLVIAAVNLQIMGKVIGTRIDFRTAFAATAYGRVAEILPIPGAAIVRGAALMQSGGNLKQTASILIWSTLLTLSMVALCAAIPLVAAMPVAGLLLAAGGLTAFIASGRWLLSRSNGALLSNMIALRIANILLSVVRFWACFAAIDAAVPLTTSALFVVAGALTTYVGIVPGGLGISEFLSAGLALIVDIPPSAAFLAAACNRIAGLAVSGIAALIVTAPAEKKAKETT